jgi:hypothetical protein
MKKISYLFISLFFLVSCSSQLNGHTVIDWVDFIKFNDKEYNGIFSGVIADPTLVSKEIGVVTFKVADHVTSPHYQIKNGDAAYWEKGTKIYRVRNATYLIAVKDKNEINGYQVYYSVSDRKFQWHYKDLPKDKIQKIEIYNRHHQLLILIDHENDIKKFVVLLDQGEVKNNFEPNSTKGDPDIFEIVIYTNEPVAYKFSILFDGTTYYWHPWDTALLPNEIGDFFQKIYR